MQNPGNLRRASGLTSDRPADAPGTARATGARMGVRHYKELICWQLAKAFRHEVATLVRESTAASQNFRYRDQIQASAASVSKNIVEGFLRYSPSDFARFLDYALASLGEAEDWLTDGIDDGYFPEARCWEALILARRCLTAIARLKQSQLREVIRRRHAVAGRQKAKEADK